MVVISVAVLCAFTPSVVRSTLYYVKLNASGSRLANRCMLEC